MMAITRWSKGIERTIVVECYPRRIMIKYRRMTDKVPKHKVCEKEGCVSYRQAKRTETSKRMRTSLAITTVVELINQINVVESFSTRL